MSNTILGGGPSENNSFRCLENSSDHTEVYLHSFTRDFFEYSI